MQFVSTKQHIIIIIDFSLLYSASLQRFKLTCQWFVCVSICESIVVTLHVNLSSQSVAWYLLHIDLDGEVKYIAFLLTNAYIAYYRFIPSAYISFIHVIFNFCLLPSHETIAKNIVKTNYCYKKNARDSAALSRIKNMK